MRQMYSRMAHYLPSDNTRWGGCPRPEIGRSCLAVTVVVAAETDQDRACSAREMRLDSVIEAFFSALIQRYHGKRSENQILDRPMARWSSTDAPGA